MHSPTIKTEIESSPIPKPNYCWKNACLLIHSFDKLELYQLEYQSRTFSINLFLQFHLRLLVLHPGHFLRFTSRDFYQVSRSSRVESSRVDCPVIDYSLQTNIKKKRKNRTELRQIQSNLRWTRWIILIRMARSQYVTLIVFESLSTYNIARLSGINGTITHIWFERKLYYVLLIDWLSCLVLSCLVFLCQITC